MTIINDYSVVVAGLTALLEPFSDRVEVVEAELGSPNRPADVVLYDTFAAPVGDDPGFARTANDSDGAVVVYSFNTDPRAVSETLASGAAGYLSKSLPAQELVDGIERVARGDRVTALGDGADRDDQPGPWPGQQAGLSPREAEMLGLIAQGLSNDAICRACYLSPNTVKTYVRTAYRKIDVTTRAQAVAWALRNGLGQDPDRRTPSTPASPRRS